MGRLGRSLFVSGGLGFIMSHLARYVEEPCAATDVDRLSRVRGGIGVAGFDRELGSIFGNGVFFGVDGCPARGVGGVERHNKQDGKFKHWSFSGSRKVVGSRASQVWQGWEGVSR